MTEPWETRVAAALSDAAEEMQPAPDGLTRIRTRLRRRWRWVRPAAAMAATAAVVVAIAGVVAVGRDKPKADRSEVGATTAAPEGATAPTPVYYVAEVSGEDGETASRLVWEPRNVPYGPDRLAAALAAVAVPPRDADYRTLWPAGTTVRSARDRYGVVTVDLTTPALSIPPADAVFGIRQLQFTALALTGRRSVSLRLLVDGVAVSTLGGVLVRKLTDLASPGATAEALAPAQVTSLYDGATILAGRLLISGEVTGEGIGITIVHNRQKLAAAPPVRYRDLPGVPDRQVWTVTVDVSAGSYHVLVWSSQHRGADTKTFTVS